MRDFFFNDTATTEIYTLSLHDALPIYRVSNSSSISHHMDESCVLEHLRQKPDPWPPGDLEQQAISLDRKSTRLNSSHANISYAVFCLKKNTLWLDQIASDMFCPWFLNA